MLRITDMNGNENRGHSLKVEGRIDVEQVEELLRAVSPAMSGTAMVSLDMSGVTFVDRAGVELLHGLRRRGVELRNCSTFIETLVNGEMS